MQCRNIVAIPVNGGSWADRYTAKVQNQNIGGRAIGTPLDHKSIALTANIAPTSWQFGLAPAKPISVANGVRICRYERLPRSNLE